MERWPAAWEASEAGEQRPGGDDSHGKSRGGSGAARLLLLEGDEGTAMDQKKRSTMVSCGGNREMSGETRKDRGREGKTGRKSADGDCLGAEDEGCGRRWRRTGGGALVGGIDGLGGG